MHSWISPPDMICWTLPMGVPPYLPTRESFHLGTTVVLLCGGPLLWHMMQFYHCQPVSRFCSIFILLRLGKIFSSLGRVPQIVLLHSSSTTFVWYHLTLLSPHSYRIGSGISPCDADTLWTIRDRSASGLNGSLLHHVLCFSLLQFGNQFMCPPSMLFIFPPKLTF